MLQEPEEAEDGRGKLPIRVSVLAGFNPDPIR